MRLRKGDDVEVMNKAEKLLSWRPAQILSSNGHIYRVQYCIRPGMASKHIEMVSRKFVRPHPPPVPLENLSVGDIVEVFSNYAWKAAVVLKVLAIQSRIVPPQDDAENHKQCLVRLLGCSMEIIVDGSSMRMRQNWHDGKWIGIGKSSRGGDFIVSRQSTADFHRQHHARTKMQPQKDAFQDSQMVSLRSLKRKHPYGSSVIEASRNGHVQKLRAIKKDGELQRMVAAPGEISYNKNVLASFKIGCNQMQRADNSSIQDSGNNSDSNACSIGSCSITGESASNVCIPFIPLLQQHSSDAESCIGPSPERKSSSLPLEEQVEVSIHWLELHAYRRTLEAMYASGPLSWDQEALLTNLRIMLHISNDEHLMELKQLISDTTTTNVR